MRGGWRPSAGVLTAAFVFTTRLRSVPVSCESGVTRLPVKIAPTTVMADDGGVCDVVPSKHHCCRLRNHAPGETLDLGLPGSDDDDIFDGVFPPGGIVLEQMLTGRAQWWSGVTSSSSTTADLGGVAQWSLGVRCVLTDSRRRMTLSGVVVTSAAGLARSMR